MNDAVNALFVRYISEGVASSVQTDAGHVITSVSATGKRKTCGIRRVADLWESQSNIIVRRIATGAWCAAVRRLSNYTESHEA